MVQTRSRAAGSVAEIHRTADGGVEHLRVDLHRPGAPTITSVGDSRLTNTENVGEAFTTAFDATILGLV
jgi:hypothetical protein